jgi:hypothetical protein
VVWLIVGDLVLVWLFFEWQSRLEVGGLHTATNIGTSLGTALAGSVLIARLTATLLTGIQQNPAVPGSVSKQADVRPASGVPFLSDDDLGSALEKAGVN